MLALLPLSGTEMPFLVGGSENWAAKPKQEKQHDNIFFSLQLTKLKAMLKLY